MGDINWLALVIGALIPMVTGFIWYHKAVFGKAWMASIGMTEEKARSANMGVTFGVSFVLSFLLAFFFTHFNNGPGQEGQYDTFQHGMFHGALIAVMVATPVLATNSLFEQKSWKNILINLGYWILTLALIGGVVDVMHQWPNVAVVG